MTPVESEGMPQVLEGMAGSSQISPAEARSWGLCNLGTRQYPTAGITLGMTGFHLGRGPAVSHQVPSVLRQLGCDESPGAALSSVPKAMSVCPGQVLSRGRSGNTLGTQLRQGRTLPGLGTRREEAVCHCAAKA